MTVLERFLRTGNPVRPFCGILESLYEHQYIVGRRKMGNVSQSRSLDIFIWLQKIREPIVMILSFLSFHWNWKSKVMPLTLAFTPKTSLSGKTDKSIFPEERPLDVLEGEGLLPCDVSKKYRFLSLLLSEKCHTLPFSCATILSETALIVALGSVQLIIRWR